MRKHLQKAADTCSKHPTCKSEPSWHFPRRSLRRSKDKLLNEIMTFAHNFDTQSELVLDHMMCTETCPCFYEVTFEENAN